MNDLGNFVSNVGFPITIALGACYVFYKVFTSLFQRVLKTCEDLTDTNKKLVETNGTFVQHFNEMKRDITEVKEKVEFICEEVVKK